MKPACFDKESISLRDYFAGQALAGHIAANLDTSNNIFPHDHLIVKWSYGMADQMMGYRAKELDDKGNGSMNTDERSAGPWTLTFKENYYGNHYPPEAKIATPDGLTVICNRDFYPTVTKNEVDLRLIAAAPEMLDALKRINAVLIRATYDVVNDRKISNGDDLTECVALIAMLIDKAEKK